MLPLFKLLDLLLSNGSFDCYINRERYVKNPTVVVKWTHFSHYLLFSLSHFSHSLLSLIPVSFTLSIKRVIRKFSKNKEITFRPIYCCPLTHWALTVFHFTVKSFKSFTPYGWSGLDGLKITLTSFLYLFLVAIFNTQYLENIFKFESSWYAVWHTRCSALSRLFSSHSMIPSTVQLKLLLNRLRPSAKHSL